jgi:hypothetical protein
MRFFIIVKAIKEDEMGWTCGTYGGMGKFIQDLVCVCLCGGGGKHEGKRSLGKPRCRWEDNIETKLKELMWKGSDLSQDRGKWSGLLVEAKWEVG